MLVKNKIKDEIGDIRLATAYKASEALPGKKDLLLVLGDDESGIMRKNLGIIAKTLGYKFEGNKCPFDMLNKIFRFQVEGLDKTNIHNVMVVAGDSPEKVQMNVLHGLLTLLINQKTNSEMRGVNLGFLSDFSYYPSEPIVSARNFKKTAIEAFARVDKIVKFFNKKIIGFVNNAVYLIYSGGKKPRFEDAFERVRQLPRNAQEIKKVKVKISDIRTQDIKYGESDKKQDITKALPEPQEVFNKSEPTFGIITKLTIDSVQHVTNLLKWLTSCFQYS